MQTVLGVRNQELAEVVQSSIKEPSWMPPFGGYLGMFHWEEAMGQTENLLERLYVLSAQEMSLDRPGGTRVSLCHPAKPFVILLTRNYCYAKLGDQIFISLSDMHFCF